MTAHKQHADAGAEKIEASFKQGVLAVTLPKKPAAQKPKKKTEVKAAILLGAIGMAKRRATRTAGQVSRRGHRFLFYLEHPKFEGFEARQTITRKAASA